MASCVYMSVWWSWGEKAGHCLVVWLFGKLNRQNDAFSTDVDDDAVKMFAGRVSVSAYRHCHRWRSRSRLYIMHFFEMIVRLRGSWINVFRVPPTCLVFTSGILLVLVPGRQCCAKHVVIWLAKLHGTSDNAVYRAFSILIRMIWMHALADRFQQTFNKNAL